MKAVFAADAVAVKGPKTVNEPEMVISYALVPVKAYGLSYVPGINCLGLCYTCL